MAMFSLRSLDFGVLRYLLGNTDTSTASRIDLPSVEIHDVEENSEKRARTLKHLIKLNHINHSVIYHDLRFHNHAPHVRCSPEGRAGEKSYSTNILGGWSYQRS